MPRVLSRAYSFPNESLPELQRESLQPTLPFSVPVQRRLGEVAQSREAGARPVEGRRPGPARGGPGGRAKRGPGTRRVLGAGRGGQRLPGRRGGYRWGEHRAGSADCGCVTPRKCNAAVRYGSNLPFEQANVQV